MSRSFMPILAVVALITGPAMAVEPALGAKLGSSAAEISAALAADGYKLTKYEREDSRIEVTAVKDQRRVKVYVDPTSGKVVKTAWQAGGARRARAGADADHIRATLEAQGYEIVKFEREPGEIEVYALRDGRRWELKIDPGSGRVLRAEEEDE